MINCSGERESCFFVLILRVGVGVEGGTYRSDNGDGRRVQQVKEWRRFG